mgnify:CR=1 FL=1
MLKNYNAPSKILDEYSGLVTNRTFSSAELFELFFKIKFLTSESSRVTIVSGIKIEHKG